MKQIHIRNIRHASFKFITTALTALVLAAPTHAETITKPMSWTPPSGMTPGPIDGTTAMLESGPFGAAMAIKSSGLTPGDVMTAWWVAVQNHHICEGELCTPPEVMSDGIAADAVVKLAAGGVVAADGTISLASFLPAGEVEGNFFETTFHSPETAEIHLALQNHGPVDPDILDEMLTSFRAGCTDESLPVFYPETALTDGPKGNFNCKTLQFAGFAGSE